MATRTPVKALFATAVAFVAVAVAAVPALGNDYLRSLGIFIALQGLVVLGLILLMGFAGQVSLGQAAFVGLGAYVSGILTVHFKWNPWLAMVAALVVTALVAAGIGAITLHLRAHYLALATLGIGIVATILFAELPLTGGPSGLLGIPSLSVAGFKFNTDARFYYLVWGIFALGMVVAYNLMRSPLGRDLKAIADSELAVRSVGVRTHRAKLRVFVVSALYAAVSGSLLAHYIGFISPDSFGVWASVRYLVMATVGGLGSIWGAPVGAMAVNMLVEILRVVVPHLLGESKTAMFESVAFGLLLILSLKYMPEGVMGWLLPERDRRGENRVQPRPDNGKQLAKAGGAAAR